MRTSVAQTRCQPIRPDALVLEGQTLAPGYDLSATSRFADDIWDLTPMNHQAHRRRITVNFTTLPEQFREAAKELFYTKMAGELPPGEGRLGLGSLRGLFTQVKNFLVWADERGHMTLSALAYDDLLAFHLWLMHGELSPSQRGSHRRAARMFWIYRDSLASDRLSMDPKRIPEWNEDNSKAPGGGENLTDRIPEQVISPLLVWALRWVDDFGPDVLAARSEWWPMFVAGRTFMRVRRAAPSKRERRRRATTRELVTTLMAEYEAAGRPLPGNPDGTVNISFLSRKIGSIPSAFRYPTVRGIVEATAQRVGVAPATYLTTPMQSHLDGAPWVEHMRWEDADLFGRLLQTACYMVVSYLSGMRDSEVKHIRRGCLSYKRDASGRIYRRLVTSQAFKGEEEPTGVTATWTVSEAVEKAIRILEQLQPAEHEFLFATLPGCIGYRRDDRDRPGTNSSTNRALNAFVEWINGYCQAHGRADRIPLVRKRVWVLATGQFRRILSA